MDDSKFERKFNLDAVIKHWNKVSSIYDKANAKFDETHHQRFIEALKHMPLKKGDKVLNIWSRTGKAVEFIRKKQDVILINYEISPKMNEIAKKRYPKEKFKTTPFYPLPDKSGTYDYVLSLEALEHTPNPMKFLRELYRVLKKGGKLIMSLPPATAEYTSVVDDFLKVGHGEGPHKFISSKKVKHMLKRAGFKLLIHKGTLLIFLGPKWLRRFSAWLEPKIQNTFLRELCIRQFYICEK